MTKTMIDKMVDRFLGWKLPKDFGPDAGISFAPTKPYEGDELGNSWWPVGTNLLTADQARQMFEHVTADDAAAEPELQRLRNIILRATAELDTVEYDNDPPARVVALLDEMRSVNRDALLAG